MALLYVRNDGSNTSPYDTWAKAATTLATALNSTSAGDTVYVADGHTESASADVSIDNNEAHTDAPVSVLCVNDVGDPEPPTALATGAHVEADVTGNFDLRFTEGAYYVYGIDFSCGRGLFISRDAQIFEQCSFDFGGDGNANGIMELGVEAADPTGHEFINCTFVLNNVNQEIRAFSAHALFRGCTFFATGTVPTYALQFIGSGDVEFFGCDFSACTNNVFHLPYRGMRGSTLG